MGEGCVSLGKGASLIRLAQLFDFRIHLHTHEMIDPKIASLKGDSSRLAPDRPQLHISGSPITLTYDPDREFLSHLLEGSQL
jgi:hypothetical protein